MKNVLRQCLVLVNKSTYVPLSGVWSGGNDVVRAEAPPHRHLRRESPFCTEMRASIERLARAVPAHRRGAYRGHKSGHIAGQRHLQLPRLQGHRGVIVCVFDGLDNPAILRSYSQANGLNISKITPDYAALSSQGLAMLPYLANGMAGTSPLAGMLSQESCLAHWTGNAC